MKLSRLFVIAGSALALPLYLSAVTLVNDTWQDGTRNDPVPTLGTPTPAANPLNSSEQGVNADLDANLECAWYFTGGTTVVAPGAMTTTVAGASVMMNTYFANELTPVNLSAVGSSMTLKLIFTVGNVNVSNASQNLHLILANTQSADRVGDAGTPPDSVYSGYGLWMNMGETINHASAMQLRGYNNTGAERYVAATASLTGLINGDLTTGDVGYTDNTQYTLTWKLTHTASSFDTLITIAGGTLNGTGLATCSFSEATPNNGSYAFDSFCFRPSNSASTANTFAFNQFQVDVIPEPATYGLLAGVAVLGLAFWRRRQA